jgi:hypothetical protein
MKTKKMKLIISIVSLIIIGALTLILPGCTEADRVNHNLSKQANYFDCERRITVYNARTDKVILYIEGYIDISNNTSSELVITAKTGNDTYKKNYVYLNQYTLYVVEDISGTHTDPYHYKVVFDTNVAPDIEVK